VKLPEEYPGSHTDWYICLISSVKPLKNILDTARDLGASKFVSYIEESGLNAGLTKEGTYTLFAPLDDAFEVSLHTLRQAYWQDYMRG
jgi:uncharacterized surface protein with fasciclin (FAS1) repeats